MICVSVVDIPGIVVRANWYCRLEMSLTKIIFNLNIPRFLKKYLNQKIELSSLMILIADFRINRIPIFYEITAREAWFSSKINFLHVRKVNNYDSTQHGKKCILSAVSYELLTSAYYAHAFRLKMGCWRV